ncbi:MULTISPECIES: phosphoenolpyruvate synthase [Thermodesulfobacterium]|jgi:pyruvate,water dikinase|uniref:phosphoenolpyruvate synthase n=1 Tax=Thermodesulfobacterium TaxID=1740 RepID=UPI000EE62885|nr:phosphoenolpyruvate synthase [Thermodesulfobacterium sp.]MBZ4681572.1 phosphoenolpyruvate synthase [Thermodesulfobacterium sp.]HCE79481.1 phosphoenolpyruvate synthase [Thermodesulfobacterium commune]
MSAQKPLILWFDQISKDDIPLVGGKNASLGEMYSKLTEKGIKVPYGFAVTAEAYRYFIKENHLDDKIKEILKGLDTHDVLDLQKRGKKIRTLLLKAKMPEKLEAAIRESYAELEKRYGKNTDVAVRSSATAEDLPDASFAGQQETFLNIRGVDNVVKYVQKCFASLFTDRAISYREDKGFDHFSVYISVAIQKMVRSDAACSGVMFTLDTETGFRDVVYITGTWGLGEALVQGKVTPDEYYVFKPTLKQGFRPILSKKLGSKHLKMVYGEDPKHPVKTVKTTKDERLSFVLSDEEILKLAKWAMIIEEHYERPMDIEWAKDGDGKTIGTGEIFIVQARPETVHAIKEYKYYEVYKLKGEGRVICTGKAVGSKIGQGKARVILSLNEIANFKPGEILVTEMTDPDWEPIMKKASAIITDRGGRTCHAAIVSRELGIPCIVGTENATKLINTGDKITVDCSQGEIGRVLEGLVDYEVERIDLEKLPETRTKIMMNVGIPEQAFAQAQIPNDGVGLARIEFIIGSHIGIHPLALLNYEKLKEEAKKDKEIEKVVAVIEERAYNYANKADFYVDKLAQGIAMIGAAFYPKDVIVRLSDFKTNEYANLVGGYLYEPVEHNPMLGWRGASRYYDPKFEPAFALECKAIKKARDEMGLTNIKVMVPFCRTVEEGERVIKVMEKYGLKQGENGLEIYVMAEIPSNVILAEEFAKIFDGFSIGSNDLTQLTLGLDRDSELVSHIYDERNPAIKILIKQLIETAHKFGRKVGICGQAPSDFPDFAAFLVECGIDSMSLSPDTVIKTRLLVAEKEKELKKKK